MWNIAFRFNLSSLLSSLVIAVFLMLSIGCSSIATAGKGEKAPATSGRAVVRSVKGDAQTSAARYEWKDLFDGKTLKGWKPTDFAGAGVVEVKDGQILLQSGAILTGINWTNEPPKAPYEICLEAMKVDGSDFFCALTFPAGEAHCTLVCGGWGGAVVGISSIDGMDASENETTKFMNFDKGHWYTIRVRVTPKKLEAWIDNEKVVDQSIENRRISMRPGEIELNVPFGIATYQTTAALRNLKMRQIENP